METGRTLDPARVDAVAAGEVGHIGRELAGLHRAGSETFGAEWPGFIGPLPQDNTPSAGPWGPWFAERRLRPYLKISADRGALPAAPCAAARVSGRR